MARSKDPRGFSSSTRESLFAGLDGKGILSNRKCKGCGRFTIYGFLTEPAYVCRACGAEFSQGTV